MSRSFVLLYFYIFFQIFLTFPQGQTLYSKQLLRRSRYVFDRRIFKNQQDNSQNLTSLRSFRIAETGQGGRLDRLPLLQRQPAAEAENDSQAQGPGSIAR